MSCQLCENLFIRFELALEHFPRLVELYRTALSEHALDEHGAGVQEKIQKFFTLPIEEYLAWVKGEPLALAPARIHWLLAGRVVEEMR